MKDLVTGPHYLRKCVRFALEGYDPLEWARSYTMYGDDLSGRLNYDA